MNNAQSTAAGQGGDQATALRRAMVDELTAMGVLRSERVAAAFDAVPREVFAASDESLQQAYETSRTLAPLRNADGLAVSVISASHVQAMMLEQAQLTAGMRVLEIGSGGYQAALIAELVGGPGSVTTMDIDPAIVARAREQLPAAGHGEVAVLEGDAEYGAPDGAPYDRILVTCGAWDVPPAWVDQLAPNGRLVVPLRMRGLTRTVMLRRDGAALVSEGCQLSAYVAVRGAGEHGERVLRIGEHATLRADETIPMEAAGLRSALCGSRVQRWSGVIFDHVDSLDLWLGYAIPQFGLLQADRAAIESGLFAHSARLAVPTTLHASGSFAYRIKRPIEGTDQFETGVRAHGPAAHDLADQYVDLIRTWDSAHRHGPGPRIEVHPAATPDDELPPNGRVLEKVHSRVVVSWP